MTRTDDMLDRYGEVVTVTAAGRILSRSAPTIRAMVQDGRLRMACGGTMVDVRSIAEYIEAPAQHNERARQIFVAIAFQNLLVLQGFFRFLCQIAVE